MFAPWRSQKSVRKHKDTITGNSFFGWNKSKIITTNRSYDYDMEAWHITVYNGRPYTPLTLI